MIAPDNLSAGYTARQYASHIPQKQRVYGLSYTLHTGQKEYYFLLVDPLKERAFQRALKGSVMMRLDDYGIVVGQGSGEPSQALKDRIALHYHVVFN